MDKAEKQSQDDHFETFCSAQTAAVGLHDPLAPSQPHFAFCHFDHEGNSSLYMYI